MYVLEGIWFLQTSLIHAPPLSLSATSFFVARFCVHSHQRWTLAYTLYVHDGNTTKLRTSQPPSDSGDYSNSTVRKDRTASTQSPYVSEYYVQSCGDQIFQSYTNPYSLASHNRRSVDENGDRSRRHLASSRAPGDHGAPLPANVDDWTSACELEQHIVPGPTLRRFEANNSPPLTQVAGPQSWSGAFNAATEMALRQPQLVAAAVNKSQLSAQDVAVEKQPTLSEMQRPVPVAGPRQLSSTGEAQQPTTSIGARKPQISEPLDRPHTISKDQKLVVSPIYLCQLPRLRNLPGDELVS